MGKVGGRNYLAGEGGQQLVKEEREGKVADGGVESKRGQLRPLLVTLPCNASPSPSAPFSATPGSASPRPAPQC